MSNNSETPNYKAKGKSNPLSKTKNEQTEDELWALDEEQEPTPEESAKITEPSSIPSEHNKESPLIESGEPAARNTGPPSGLPAHDESTEGKAAGLSKPSSEENGDDKESDTPISGETDTPSANATSVISNKSHIASPSKMGKIGIVTFIAILCLTATLWLIIHFSDSLVSNSLKAQDLELPVEGKLVTVSSVETYWREPVREGENKDIVRLGVKIIPVLRLKIQNASSSSSAIRVLFRNAEETIVGDSISRPISKQETLEISATDGFSDLGMHAAYRTGENSRWNVQVLEGPTVNAPIKQFDTLFETEISTDMR